MSTCIGTFSFYKSDVGVEYHTIHVGVEYNGHTGIHIPGLNDSNASNSVFLGTQPTIPWLIDYQDIKKMMRRVRINQ